METIKVPNSNINSSTGFWVTMFWLDDGYVKAKRVRREDVWHTGTGREVMARILPGDKNRQKIIEAIATKKIELASLDNVGGEHGGYTDISI